MITHATDTTVEIVGGTGVAVTTTTVVVVDVGLGDTTTTVELVDGGSVVVGDGDDDGGSDGDGTGGSEGVVAVEIVGEVTVVFVIRSHDEFVEFVDLLYTVKQPQENVKSYSQVYP